MKIGVLTFHGALNIGAQLQVFALCHVLHSLGHDVEIINYLPDFITRPYKFYNTVSRKYGILSVIKQTLIYTFKDLLFVKKRLRHYYKFQRNYLPISTKRFINVRELSYAGYDAIIVGSDQIWNTEFTGNCLDDFYTLNANLRSKKISYAASFNEKTMTFLERDLLIKRLSTFQAISVRESQLKSFLQQDNFDIKVSIDPTLLLSKDEWLKFVNSEPIIKGKYILCHQARGDSKVFNEAIKRFAQNLRCKIINTSGVNYRKGENNSQFYNPLEYLNLANHAQCVISASFHATATAFILEKPFFSIKIGDGRDGRESDLLRKVGLTQQIVTLSELSNISAIPLIDFCSSKFLLKEEKKASFDFIKKSLY